MVFSNDARRRLAGPGPVTGKFAQEISAKKFAAGLPADLPRLPAQKTGKGRIHLHHAVLLIDDKDIIGDGVQDGHPLLLAPHNGKGAFELLPRRLSARQRPLRGRG